jgi:5-methyltetrahydrofolate--homocysteine methyltransferase
MIYKEDWPQARERIEAFWEGEVLDRVCLAVTAPREEAFSASAEDAANLAEDSHSCSLSDLIRLPEPESDEARYTDPEFIIKYNDVWFWSVFWGGEAVPEFTNRLGYVVHGNPEVSFSRDTVWGDPWLPSSSPDVYRFDSENRWWRVLCEVQKAVLADSRGKYLVKLPAIDPPTDILSTIRGAGELCMDLIERPDDVHAILRYLTEVRDWMDQVLYVPLLEEYGGIALSSREWGPGRSYALQCDFSAMISPRHFREFVMPELIHFADASERCRYHLDGVDALRHLPAILEIEKIKYVQWVPGAGAPDGLHWQDVWETLRAAGRGMQTRVAYARVEETVKEWGAEGLFLVTTAPDEAAARDLLKRVERWSCRHPWDIR